MLSKFEQEVQNQYCFTEVPDVEYVYYSDDEFRCYKTLSDKSLYLHYGNQNIPKRLPLRVKGEKKVIAIKKRINCDNFSFDSKEIFEIECTCPGGLFRSCQVDEAIFNMVLEDRISNTKLKYFFKCFKSIDILSYSKCSLIVNYKYHHRLGEMIRFIDKFHSDHEQLGLLHPVYTDSLKQVLLCREGYIPLFRGISRSKIKSNYGGLYSLLDAHHSEFLVNNLFDMNITYY